MSVLRRHWARAKPGWVAVAGLVIETRRRGLKVFRLALCNLGNTAGGLARSRRRLWSMDNRCGTEQSLTGTQPESSTHEVPADLVGVLS